jgi:hypothetical protein
VPGLVRLADELADLGAGAVDDVVGAGARLGVVEPAPAAAVGALAGVDDHQGDLAGGAARAGAVVGRGAPDRLAVVRALGGLWGRGRGLEVGLDVDAAHGGHHAVEGLDLDAVAYGLVDLGVHVVGLTLEVLDAAVGGDDRGPGADALTVEGAALRELVQEGGGGADVGGADELGLDLGDAGELGGAGDLLLAQAHDAEGRLLALELLLADDHLPAGLGVGDRLEDLGGDVELAAGAVKGVADRAEQLLLGGGGVLLIAAVLCAAREVDAAVLELFDGIVGAAGGEGEGREGGGGEEDAAS